MDLTTILPLLMQQRGSASTGQNSNQALMDMLLQNSGTKGDPTAAILKEMLNQKSRGGQASGAKTQQTAPPPNPDTMNADMLAQLLRAQNGGSGGSADLMPLLLNLMQSRAKTSSTAAPPEGLVPILGIADNQTLGKLTRHFAKPKQKQ